MDGWRLLYLGSQPINVATMKPYLESAHHDANYCQLMRLALIVITLEAQEG